MGPGHGDDAMSRVLFLHVCPAHTEERERGGGGGVRGREYDEENRMACLVKSPWVHGKVRERIACRAVRHRLPAALPA